MRFKDEANIRVSGGDGGDGAVSWRREKYVPRGGPDGGDGGSGGAVVLVADSGVNTLIDFSANPHIEAEHGKAGSATRSAGADGSNTLVKVPVGTQVFYQERLIADLPCHGARWVAARGGVGGKGNAFFKSSTNQAPQYAQPGRKGESFEFHLVLKSVADVGLVGLPNVGKSTLIAAISNAKPLIADYPFTTITPNLGVVSVGQSGKFVIADIPGLIEDAHLGKGLGVTFLKHVERTTVLAHMIDVTTTLDGGRQSFVLEESATDEQILKAATEQIEVIERELRNFSPALLELPRLVVFTKADLGFAERAYLLMKKSLDKRGLPAVLISAPSHIGLEELCEKLLSLVEKKRNLLQS